MSLSFVSALCGKPYPFKEIIFETSSETHDTRKLEEINPQNNLRWPLPLKFLTVRFPDLERAETTWVRFRQYCQIGMWSSVVASVALGSRAISQRSKISGVLCCVTLATSLFFKEKRTSFRVKQLETSGDISYCRQSIELFRGNLLVNCTINPLALTIDGKELFFKTDPANYKWGELFTDVEIFLIFKNWAGKQGIHYAPRLGPNLMKEAFNTTCEFFYSLRSGECGWLAPMQPQLQKLSYKNSELLAISNQSTFTQWIEGLKDQKKTYEAALQLALELFWTDIVKGEQIHFPDYIDNLSENFYLYYYLAGNKIGETELANIDPRISAKIRLLNSKEFVMLSRAKD